MQRCICQPDDRQTLRIRPLRTDLVGRSSLRSSQPGTRAPSRSGFVITVLLSAAPGSSPFRRIPETIDSLPHPSEECKRFVKRAQNFRRRDIFTGEYAAKRRKMRTVLMYRPQGKQESSTARLYSAYYTLIAGRLFDAWEVLEATPHTLPHNT